MSGEIRVARVSAVSRGHLLPVGDRDGRVHSVFTRSCNLAVDDQLLIVHGTGIPHTPTSVRVAGLGWTPWTRPGDAVTLRGGELSFGAHVIDLQAAEVWSPADGRRWSPTQATTVPLASRVAELRRTHCAVHRHESVLGLDAAVAGLARGLAAGAEDPAEHAAELAPVVARLIGLGPGLTPSGDDVLVGVLAALHRCAGPRAASMAGGLGAVVGPLLGRTTVVSAHHLRLAVAGAFSEPLLDLTDALLGGAPAALTARTRRVLAIGASSGADAVLGLLTGLDLALGPDNGRSTDSLDDAPDHEKVA